MANPWEEDGNPWGTKPKFFSWVRGHLREGWKVHPIKLLYQKSRRYKAPIGKVSKDGEAKLVWATTCEECGKEFRSGQYTADKVTQCDIQVDHIDPSGSFNELSDSEGFIKRMFFVTFDDLRELCIHCHELYTLMASHNLEDLDEAKKEKLIIEACKDKHLQKVLVEDFGYTEQQTSNQEKRRGAVRELVNKGLIK